MGWRLTVLGRKNEGEKKILAHTHTHFLVNMMTLFLHSRLVEIGRVEGTNMGFWIPL